jgi:hypothetical protein
MEFVSIRTAGESIQKVIEYSHCAMSFAAMVPRVHTQIIASSQSHAAHAPLPSEYVRVVLSTNYINYHGCDLSVGSLRLKFQFAQWSALAAESLPFNAGIKALFLCHYQFTCCFKSSQPAVYVCVCVRRLQAHRVSERDSRRQHTHTCSQTNRKHYVHSPLCVHIF